MDYQRKTHAALARAARSLRSRAPWRSRRWSTSRPQGLAAPQTADKIWAYIAHTISSDEEELRSLAGSTDSLDSSVAWTTDSVSATTVDTADTDDTAGSPSLNDSSTHRRRARVPIDGRADGRPPRSR